MANEPGNAQIKLDVWELEEAAAEEEKKRADEARSSTMEEAFVGKGRMANNSGHSEIIETVEDVRMLEVVAEPDKKSSDAATTSAVEEADEDPGKMEVAEIPIQGRKMKEVIEDPATHSTMEQKKLENMEVLIDISSPLKKVKGFRQSYVDEIESYPANQWKSRNVVYDQGSSGFYKVPRNMRQRQGWERLFDPTYINFSKIRDMLENDHPDDETRSLLSHYYYYFSVIRKVLRGKKLEYYLLMIYEDREEIARCYGLKEADLDFPQLLGLLLSSCFVFYLLYLPYITFKNDTESFHRWVNDLWLDLLVLENQIPFFILQKLFHEYIANSYSRMSSYTYYYFREFVPLNWIHQNVDGVHLLDIVHRSLLPDKQSDHRSYSFFTKLLDFCYRLRAFLWGKRKYFQLPVIRVIPTATRLQEAGVQFRSVERKGFVAEFKNGVFKLPRLPIRKNTEKFFMNLIAWEQCHQPAVKYVINFAILMDHLINTSKDVEILIQNNVLELSQVTEEEVAAMFNRLGEDLIYTKNEWHNREYDFLTELSIEVNKYCESRLNIWWANLMKVYFSSPWTILSLIGALLLILLTLVQAFFSTFSYFRPPKQYER